MLLEYNGTHDYQENYLQNGYQMGFENSVGLYTVMKP